MRAVLQRVSRACVSIDGEIVGRIQHGFVALVGVAKGDGPADISYVASKISDMRVFGDDDERMNRSIRDVGGAVLVVSQFTLLGDARKGRRPAFDAAETPDVARRLYDEFLQQLRATGIAVEAGRFQATMQVELVNDGPVTILLDSRRTF